jgi:hypothetical protein
MPYKRIGTTVYKKLPNGKLKSVGVSDSVNLAKAHLRALYAAETNESIGNIEKTITEILKNKTVTESSSGNINPKVQSFLDECDRIMNILMDDDLFKQEQAKHNSR